MEYLDRFLELLNTLPPWLAYFFLGLSAFIENIFPPIPGDTITAFGAFMVGTNRLSFFGVYASTTVGSLAGFMALFWTGRLLGRTYFLEREFRFFKREDIVRAEEWFRKYGYLLVLMNRFLPGIRSVISISGGISRLNTLKVAALALISCAVWNLIWIAAGYSLGANWDTVREGMSRILLRYNTAVFIILGIVVAWFLLKKFLFSKKEPS